MDDNKRRRKSGIVLKEVKHTSSEDGNETSDKSSEPELPKETVALGISPTTKEGECHTLVIPCKRSRNSTESENMKLIDIIVKYKSIIENKRCDSAAWDEKDAAWQDIARDYNDDLEPDEKRSVEQLKKKYTNLKKRIKAKLVLERQEFYKTGRRPKTVDFTRAEQEVMAKLLGDNGRGLTSSYDPEAISEELLIPELTWEKSSQLDLKGPVNSLLTVTGNGKENGRLEYLEKEAPNVQNMATQTLQMANEEASTSEKNNKKRRRRSSGLENVSLDSSERQLYDAERRQQNKREHEMKMRVLEYEEMCGKMKLKVLEMELKIREAELNKLCTK